MDFTVLIPSRNRPTLLERAIKSVLQITYGSYEVLIINDGSDGEHAPGYRDLERRYAERTRFVHLDPQSAPHGKSVALNVGIAKATGEFLAFLDDDDYWLPSDHLTVAKAAITENASNLDLIFSNQRAGRGDFETEDLWLAALGRELAAAAALPDTQDMFWVTSEVLLRQPGFCHMNTTLIRRSLMVEMQGFHEGLLYEVDRDFYLRAIDQARGILYRPVITSYHCIPEREKAATMSTRATPLVKLLEQLTFFNKNLAMARRAVVRASARRSKRYALKELAELHVRAGDYTTAFHFAREALLIGFTMKWALYTTWLGIQAIRRNDPDRPSAVRVSNVRTRSSVTSG